MQYITSQTCLRFVIEYLTEANKFSTAFLKIDSQKITLCCDGLIYSVQQRLIKPHHVKVGQKLLTHPV